MDTTHTISSAAKSRKPTARFRWHLALIALASGAAGAYLAFHYPVVPSVALMLFAVMCAVFFRWPDSWLLVIPGVLPLIGFAPWTGWLTFEELDLLVLAAAVGGYARSALPGLPRPHKSQRAHLISPGAALLMLLFAASTLVAMQRGFTDAGGFAFGWFQGYHEPMNSVRLAKSFFLAMLVLPLWWAAVARRADQAAEWLATGLCIGLAAAAVTTVWERMAFVGLFNFSSDYRTTGMFWEMHVGGAALDGFLALTIPFAVRELFVARSAARWGAAVACVALAAYACLTTFSRGVYLAVPMGVAVTFFCCVFAARRQSARPATAQPALAGGVTAAPVAPAQHHIGLLPATLLVIVFAVSIWWIFPSSGYRGMLAVLGAMAIAMPLARLLRSYRPVDWAMAVVAGAVLSAVAWGIAWAVPKGAYFAYALSFAFCVCMLFLWHHSARMGPGRNSAGLAAQLTLSGQMASLVSAMLVADHWGDATALRAMLAVVAVLFVMSLLSGAVPKPLWPTSYRWQATTLAAMAMVGAIFGVMGGGVYMAERFSTSESDLDGRLAHWREGRAMLTGPLDPVLGKGLGRYPASFFFAASSTEYPGDYRLKAQAGNTYLTLGGGKQKYMGWGEILRVSQRMPAPKGPVTATLKARAAQPVNLHLEVCQKHLLYNAGCLLGDAALKDTPGEWQELRIPLRGNDLVNDDWYAPKLVVFSIATDTVSGVVDIDQIQMTDGSGQPLIDNGNFSEGMKRWFFSSDRNHLPWHIKNVLMNVLFDQGAVGLFLFVVMGAAALWRVVLGRAKDHPLAPGIAGGLVGFIVVGLFDSLVDVPRLAFVFYFVLMLGLTVRYTRPRPTTVNTPAATA